MDIQDAIIATAPPIAPDLADLLGFGPDNAYAKPLDFLRDAVRKYLPNGDASEGEKAEAGQDLDDSIAVAEAEGLTYSVSPAPEIVGPKGTSRPVIEPVASPARKAKGVKRGRPRKRGRPKGSGVDKRRKGASGPLTRAQRNDIVDAMDFGAWQGRYPCCTVNFHPSKLRRYPQGDLRDWFIRGPWADMSEEMRRRQVRAGDPHPWWLAVAVAENYMGDRRQHWHVIFWCPDDATRDDIGAMLARRYPGEGAIDVGDLDEDGLAYRLKQSAPNAFGPPRPGRGVAEVVSRYDGAPVAEVWGRRYHITRSLALPERRASGWQAVRDGERAARRDYWRARAREDADAASPPAKSPSNGIPVGASI